MVLNCAQSLLGRCILRCNPGPLFFVNFINDIGTAVSTVNFVHQKFTDDTKVVSAFDDAEHAAIVRQMLLNLNK